MGHQKLSLKIKCFVLVVIRVAHKRVGSYAVVNGVVKDDRWTFEHGRGGGRKLGVVKEETENK